MKRKSRHKLVAVEFLSNISLDGSHPAKFSDSNIFQQWVAPTTDVSCHYSSGFQKRSELRQTSENKIIKGTLESEKRCNSLFSTHPDNLRYGELKVELPEKDDTAEDDQAITGTIETLSRYRCLNNPINSSTGVTTALPTGRENAATRGSTVAASLPLSALYDSRDLSCPANVAQKPEIVEDHSVRNGARSVVDILHQSTSKRLAVRPSKIHKTVVAVFSIIPYNRRKYVLPYKSHLKNYPQYLASPTGSIDSETTVIPFNSGLVKQATLANSKNRSSSGSATEPSRSLSSFRPIGEEIISYAEFLQPARHTPRRRTFSINLLPACGQHAVKSEAAAQTLKESPLCSSNRSSTLFESNPNLASGTPLTARANLSPAARQAIHTQSPFIGGALGHHRQLSAASSTALMPWSRTTNIFNRLWTSKGTTNLDMDETAPLSVSSTALNNFPPNSATVVPFDPLISYVPCLLDDPDLLIVKGKRVLQLPNYLCSVLTYVRPNEQKRNVNQQFHERFPCIQLTLTKLRSIKSEIIQIVYKLSLDLWIAAHAHVLFEKLILKLFVDKVNRKLCAAAALLISAKLNDVKGSDLTALLQEVESTFRISRRDLTRTELDVSLGLEFCLVPVDSEIIPHYLRIHKNLDLAPTYPISCLTQLSHACSVPSVSFGDRT